MKCPVEFLVRGTSTDLETGQFHLSGESQRPKLPYFRPISRALFFSPKIRCRRNLRPVILRREHRSDAREPRPRTRSIGTIPHKPPDAFDDLTIEFRGGPV